MKSGTVFVNIEADFRRAVTALKLLQLQAQEAHNRKSARERLKTARACQAAGQNLDVQVVTGKDGVTRVHVRHLSGRVSPRV